MKRYCPTDCPNDCSKEQLQLLYTSCVSEIAAFKDQQWKTAYYATLLYSAIVWIACNIKNLTALEWATLTIASFGAFCSSLYIITDLGGSIHKRRQRLTQIRRHYTVDFMIAWSGGQPLKEIVDDPDQKESLDVFFSTVMFFGFIATLWLIFHAILNSQC